MKLGTLACVALASLALAAMVGPAQSGQVRVNASGTTFSPSVVTVNTGDHVVWVWTLGGHTVTSGSGAPSGLFNSGGGALGLTNARFSWKSTTSTPYYCAPHFSFGMTGTVTAFPSGALVSSFRITEVFFNDPNGQDFVEIANLGDAAGNLGQYRLSLAAGVALTLPLVDINVPIGGRVVIWVNRSGTNTQTELFFAAQPELARIGSASLYVPNTVNTSLTLADQLVDFVQWGDVDQPNAGTAVSASLWNGSETVTAPAVPHPIEFCGNESQRGASFWEPRQLATPGGSDCTTPTKSATWGRIKNAYR